MEPDLIRRVGNTLPYLHHLDLIYGTVAQRWSGKEVRLRSLCRLTPQDDYRASFELFKNLRVFGSNRIASHSVRYDQYTKYEALELIVVRSGPLAGLNPQYDQFGPTIYYDSTTGRTYFPRPSWAQRLPLNSELDEADDD